MTFEDRPPADKDEHIRKLLEVNSQQADRIKSLAKENGQLRATNTKLKAGRS